MQNIFTRKSQLIKGATDVFAICDIPGLADLAESVDHNNESRHMARGHDRNWDGGVPYDTALKQLRTGDLASVAASDKLLDSIEAEGFLTQTWRIKRDVVGGVPDVGAYLAGHPLNMRRRERVMAEQGPISIFVSMELSGGIEAKIMQKRGVAILALVRLLSNSRPVELYACCSVGGHGYAGHVLTRIDTAPLDLARAAHVLTSPCVTRGIGYATCHKIIEDATGHHWGGKWAYASHELYIKHAREILTGAVNPMADALLIPAAHLNDPAVKTPVKWLETMLRQYGGLETEAA